MTDQQPDPNRIEPSFRYGSAIMIGVLTGFSLAFVTNWAANPIPWGWKDLPGVVTLVAGVILQIAGVWLLLDPRSLELARYRRAIRFFLAGMVLVGIGVAAAIIVDFVAISGNFSPGIGAGGH
jgi:hypothetical protein